MQKKGKVQTIIPPRPKIFAPGNVSMSPSNKSSNSKLSSITHSKKLSDLQPTSEQNNQSISNSDIKQKESTVASLISCDPLKVDQLFREKCKSICFRVDFSEGISSAKISYKEEVLSEIYSIFLLPKCPISDTKENYDALFTLVAFHLYRTPPELPPLWLSTDDFYFQNEVFHEQIWIHNSIIYNILLAFLKKPSFNFKFGEKYVGELTKLSIFLSRSIDDREQEMLKQLLSTIYINFPKLRRFMLSVMQNSFRRVIDNIDPYSSCKVTLDALKNIVKGFKVPLKKEHEILFLYFILPLHRCQFLSYFYKELYSVCVAFLEKNSELVFAMFNVLNHFWPRLQPSKQLIFLEEFGYISSFVSEQSVPSIYKLFLSRYTQSIKGCHCIVSEKALSLLEINDFVWLITIRADLSYPILLPAIYMAAASHWNNVIRLLAATALKALCLNNEKIFNYVGKNLKNIENHQIVHGIETAALWRDLIFQYSNREDGSNKIKQLAQIFIGCESFLHQPQAVTS